VINDVALTALVKRIAGDLLGEDHVHELPRPSMGGEDFACYLSKVPGAMFRLGCARTAAGGPHLHAPDFDVDEAALPIGARILAHAVVEWCDPESPVGTSFVI